MQIYFGLELDDLVLPQPAKIQGGTHYVGSNGLLTMLETHLGLTVLPANNEYLRIEQYRQAIMRHSADCEAENTSFYCRSFDADQFATAAELLSRRDELLLAGWDFSIKDDLPFRLKTLAEIEAIFQNEPSKEEESKLNLSLGFADRFIAIFKNIGKRSHPIQAIHLNEPMEILPFYFQKLFKKLKENSTNLIIQQIENEPFVNTGNDLSRFKNRLLTPSAKQEKIRLKNDGSLLLLKAKRASDAASYLAKIFKENSDFRPACLVPEKNRALDIALIQEGFPSLGIQSASLARPTLQILKLVPAFLWNPIDPFKILEFVSLSVKPLDDGLANVIAREMAQAPGIDGEGWFIAVSRYFEKLKTRAQTDKKIDASYVNFQYEFWFKRSRYPADKTVPKGEVIDVFDYVQNWAYQLFGDTGEKNNSLLVLSEQAKRIKELLEVLPEIQLTYLELERIVRTIYEPSPVVFQEREVGHLSFVMNSSAIIRRVEKLVWWNFVQNEPVHFFSRWYEKERKYMQSVDCQLVTPKEENELLVWQRSRPVLNTGEQLVLIMPEMVAGSVVHPHPLFGDLEATFDNLEDIVFNLGNQNGRDNFAQHFNLPALVNIPQRQLGKPKPFLQIPNFDKLSDREYETLTSLEALFYYPYQWMFKYKIKLNQTSILSVVDDNRLLGNLAHRMFENLFNKEKQDVTTWEKAAVEDWIEKESPDLLRREGAVLLMYGREPEKIAFINKLKYSAWSLVSQIQENGWKIEGTEMNLQGDFQGMPIKGRTDLVLKRGDDELAILDFKYRGATRRERIIRNQEDLQLVLYSKLLTEDDSWAHTGYFIMEDGKMIARNNLAFKNIIAVSPDVDHTAVNQEILQKMEATYAWRMQQLAAGKVEIRCKQTCGDLEDIYYETETSDTINQLLEMKDGDAFFDDYRTLINLVE
ncbi:MAG: ATP-dependent helicase/nuclease subunit B [Paraglaciecola sp.]|jgi:ATP-dependent helicase/nuclease subunit B